jgi:hypothetical protein
MHTAQRVRDFVLTRRVVGAVVIGALTGIATAVVNNLDDHRPWPRSLIIGAIVGVVFVAPALYWTPRLLAAASERPEAEPVQQPSTAAATTGLDQTDPAQPV